jgi:hypothetical protein
VSGLVFIFCALGLNFGGTEGIVSRFYVLCSRTHFRRYRERRVPFSCFAPLDSFTTVHSAPILVFMFSALPDPFWVVLSSSDHDFICCAPRLVLGATKGAVSRFHVLRPCTHF